MIPEIPKYTADVFEVLSRGSSFALTVPVIPCESYTMPSARILILITVIF